MSDFLSQEEIDKLMNSNTGSENTPEVEALSNQVIDVLGEVGNITMSNAATTLSTLLGKKVNITTPQVTQTTMQSIADECVMPKVVLKIEFKGGLEGINVLMMNTSDAAIISDLMMGGSGEEVTTDGASLSELELSAVSEAMNQMMGAASTAMAQMLGFAVDIHPPTTTIWDGAEDINTSEITKETDIVKTAFRLTVDSLIDSEIMQIYSMTTINSIMDILLPSQSTETKQEEAAPPVQDSSVAQQTEQQPLQQSVPSPSPQPAEQGTATTQQPLTDPVYMAPEAPSAGQNINVKTPVFTSFDDQPVIVGNQGNLDLILDVPLEFSVVLGKTKMTIADIIALTNGSVVELNKFSEEPLEIMVNGKLIAKGEVVVINENFGIRITNILSREERIKNLK
jgi:flagellar motor switch protein FliN/FliY